MPYIPRQASIINKADNSGAGMKKTGLIRGGFPRVSHRLFMSRVLSVMPAKNTNTDGNSYGRTSYRRKIV